jgi:hypothetical protein
MMDLKEELDGVQELIAAAGRTVCGAANMHAAVAFDGWSSQQLSYLLEATKHLNRAYALVRAIYGTEDTVPHVDDFVVRRVRESDLARSEPEQFIPNSKQPSMLAINIGARVKPRQP